MSKKVPGSDQTDNTPAINDENAEAATEKTSAKDTKNSKPKKPERKPVKTNVNNAAKTRVIKDGKVVKGGK